MDKVVTPVYAQNKNTGYHRIFNEKTSPYWLLSPSLLFIGIMIVYPVCRTLYFSLTDYRVYAPNDINFVGLQNYVDLFSDREFPKILSNSLIWLVGILCVQFAVGMLLALILRNQFAGRKVFNSLMLVPWVTPGVVAALMWSWLYNGNYGVFNYYLFELGLIPDYVAWLAKSDTALFSCMLVIIWQGIPFFAVILTSAMMGISRDLYEAAHMDGASGPRCFFHITLPLIKETIFVTTMLRIIWITNNVDTIVVMTGGGPGVASRTLAVHAYLTAQQNFKFGYASSIAVILAFAMSVVAIIYMRALQINKE